MRKKDNEENIQQHKKAHDESSKEKTTKLKI